MYFNIFVLPEIKKFPWYFNLACAKYFLFILVNVL